jgi:hypothetical protein
MPAYFKTNRMTMRYLMLFVLAATTAATLCAQRQYADTLFSPPIDDPAYAPGAGPTVYIDAGHQNFHTKDGRYRPFATVLERDGYPVRSFTGPFTAEALRPVDILVISNALNERNVGNWARPIHPAFTPAEVATVRDWVAAGGNLFLIADHMPMAGAAADLAGAFGYTFYDGFAIDTSSSGGSIRFTRDNGLLHASALTDEGYPVDSIVSFTGQAFAMPAEATPILRGGENWISLQPDTAWQFHAETPLIAADTLYQGAYQTFGDGRLVVFGEAAMFSAQVVESNGQTFRAGMNHPGAPYNYQLLLNIVHWLDPRSRM